MEELIASPSNWLSNLEMDDDYDLFPQEQGLNFLDDEEFLSHEIMNTLHQGELVSCESNSSLNNYDEMRPTKQLKTSTSSLNSSTAIAENNHFSPSSSTLSSSPTSQILSFDTLNDSSPATTNSTQFHGLDFALNPKHNRAASIPVRVSGQPQMQNGSSENKTFETKKPQSQGTKRTHANAQDHIMAERKRREKLSQSLIALAALIPGLKKMDKASVLGDAIKYVKELKERLKVLEEESNKRPVESVVTVNKSALSSDDHSSSSSDETFEAASGAGGESLPHIEARVADKDVLLRIHCHKQKGLYVKLLSQIQGLHLFVANSSVLPFGDSILDITIVAQMGRDYNLTIKDLVRSLRVATLKSIS